MRFAVDHFTVSIHGRLLSQRTFAHVAAYQAALRAAPIVSLSWDVLPGKPQDQEPSGIMG